MTRFRGLQGRISLNSLNLRYKNPKIKSLNHKKNPDSCQVYDTIRNRIYSLENNFSFLPFVHWQLSIN